MLKYIVLNILIGISFVYADNIQILDKLEAEKQALILKLEAYSLKKKIIEMQNFIADDKLKKEKKLEREKALIQLKKDLSADRKRVRPVGLGDAR